jgi:hypothetical protein
MKPATVAPGSLPRCRRLCEAYREPILRKPEQGFSARRICRDLAAEHGFPGAYPSVERFVRRLATIHPAPIRRMEVDLGPGSPARLES